MRLAWLGRDTSRRPATPPRGVCRARAADCALAPLACAPPLARCRYMPVFARRKRRRLHRLDEPLLCFAQPWHGITTRLFAYAYLRAISALRTSDGTVGRVAPRPPRPQSPQCPHQRFIGAKHGGEAATRGGASADGGTRQTPRMRMRGATGGIPTKRLAPQSRMDGAPYAGCARGSRRCAAGTPSKLRADRMCRAGNAAAAS